MDVKLKSFDIRKPKVNIGTKPFLTIDKTVVIREPVSQSGLAKLKGTAVKAKVGIVTGFTAFTGSESFSNT